MKKTDKNPLLRAAEIFLSAIDREINRAWDEVDRICTKAKDNKTPI